MLTLYILSFLVAVVTSEVDIEQFYGKWMPIFTYPNNPMPILTKCEEYNIARKNNTAQCQCGDRNNVPILEITSLLDNRKFSFPVLTVNTSAEVNSTLQLECKCDGETKQHIIFKPMKDNYFIQYEYQYGMEFQYSEKEPNTASIWVKEIPSVFELYDMYFRNDGRKGSVLCVPALFSDRIV